MNDVSNRSLSLPRYLYRAANALAGLWNCVCHCAPRNICAPSYPCAFVCEDLLLPLPAQPFMALLTWGAEDTFAEILPFIIEIFLNPRFVLLAQDKSLKLVLCGCFLFSILSTLSPLPVFLYFLLKLVDLRQFAFFLMQRLKLKQYCSCSFSGHFCQFQVRVYPM